MEMHLDALQPVVLTPAIYALRLSVLPLSASLSVVTELLMLERLVTMET